MEPLPIIPRYKLLIKYDVRHDMYERYYQYVLGEYIPALNNLGLYRTWAWHTAYGDYPLRQLEFVTDSWQTLHEALQTSRWHELEEGLQRYTLHYQRKIVRYRSSFQF